MGTFRVVDGERTTIVGCSSTTIALPSRIKMSARLEVTTAIGSYVELRTTHLVVSNSINHLSEISLLM
jgi:hypothetical protein